MRSFAVFAALVAVGVPGGAWGCAVCFGADTDNASVGRAFNVGITLILGITFALLAGGAAWLWRMERRRQALDARYFELLESAERSDVARAGGEPLS